MKHIALSARLRPIPQRRYPNESPMGAALLGRRKGEKSRSRRRAACGPSRSWTSTGSAGALANRNTRPVCARLLLTGRQQRRKSVVEKLGSVAKGRVVTRTGRRPPSLGHAASATVMRSKKPVPYCRSIMRICTRSVWVSDVDQPWSAGLSPFGASFRAQRLVVVGVAAHQHLGDSANVVLVEQPDLGCGDLLRVAHADRLRNARAAFAEELARRRLNVRTTRRTGRHREYTWT